MKLNKKSQWYFHKNLKPIGPISEEEMRIKIHRGEVGPQDLICNEISNWRPALEWGVFEFQLFPAAQGFVPGIENLPNVSEWVLLVDGVDEGGSQGQLLQEGPFTTEEIMNLLEAGVVSPSQYIWKRGLSGWSFLKDRPEFQSLMTSERLIAEE